MPHFNSICGILYYKMTEKEDLRVVRTKEAIRSTFEQMICEMDYDKISVKELTERARINRKTFYIHYNSMDSLLFELQNELVEDFLRRTKDFSRPQDMDKITREFFVATEAMGKLGERLCCSGSYAAIGGRITKEIMDKAWKAEGGSLYVRNIVTAYVSQSTLEIYRQWVADGKKIPLEDIIKLASRLVCHGVSQIDEKLFKMQM